MSEWPYLHRAGHLRARVTEETAETVTIEYNALDDPSWAIARTVLSKDHFRNLYSPAPQPPEAP